MYAIRSYYEGWGVADRNLERQPLAGAFRLEESALAQARLSGEPQVRLHYPTVWPLLGPAAASYVDVTVPLLRQGDFVGALQARFSLAEVRERVASAQKLILLYALLYRNNFV